MPVNQTSSPPPMNLLINPLTKPLNEMKNYQFTVTAWRNFIVEAECLEDAENILSQETREPFGWEHEETRVENNGEPIDDEHAKRLVKSFGAELVQEEE